MKQKTALILLALLGLQLFFLINLQFTAWPEMLTYPYLHNNGYLLYRDLVHPYTPALTMFLAILYKIFGYKLWVMQAVVWLQALANTLLIFLFTRKLTGKYKYGLQAAGLYVLTQPFLEGNMLWSDVVIVTPVLLGLFFLIDKKFIWSGLFLVIAALIKQTAALFLITTIIYLIASRVKMKELVRFAIGPIVLSLALFIRLLTEHSFTTFLNWTLIYPSKYWTKFPNYVQMHLSEIQVIIVTLLSVPVIAYLFWKPQKKMPSFKRLLLGFLGIALFIVYPRFSFFHFQTALALIAVMLGIVASKYKPKYWQLSFYLLVVIYFVSYPQIKVNWQKEARFYTVNDLEFASHISTPKSVLLLRLPSSYYVFSNTLPPKPWLDNFGWYWEVPGVQADTLASWSKSPPELIYSQVSEPGNWWELGTYQPADLVNWIQMNYHQIDNLSENINVWQRN